MKTKKRPATAIRIAFFAALIVLLGITATIAFAYTPPSFVSETLEGCDFHTGLTLPNSSGRYICPDAYYTTGNMGKGWNELDLVPHRLTTQLGTQSGATTNYNLIIGGDYIDGGKKGWDVISVPVLNASKSDLSCTISAGDQLVETGGTGGTTSSIYRIVTIHQNPGTTCVFDYYQRLALGAALYPGSSLQSYMFEQNDFRTGKKTLSIPVKEALPQGLSKTMTATQGTDHVWDVTKLPSPANLSFTNTCGPAADLKQSVSIQVKWEIKPANPSGPVTIITHVYATNPAARSVTVNVTDKIYKGTGQLDADLLDTAATVAGVVVPANTQMEVLTHTYVWATPDPLVTQFNDVATATYTDTVAGVAIPGSVVANASATKALTGSELNKSAVIKDSESISGTGLTFSADSFTPAVGSFDSPYVAGTATMGPVGWTSASQTASGSVTFSKTVYVGGPTIVNGSLTDTANLTGIDGFKTSANGEVKISTNATVSLTINKTVDVAPAAATTFAFKVSDGITNPAKDASITIAAGALSGSTIVSGLTPGVLYTVSEVEQSAWVKPADQTVKIDLPSCSGSLTFANIVKKDLTVSKTANPAFTRTFKWGITKSVIGDALKNISGGLATFGYNVDVTHDAGTDSAWKVTGDITVTNPNVFDVTGVTVTDAINNELNAACVVTSGTNVTVPAGKNVLLSYTCTYAKAPAAASQVNTATAAWTSYGSPNASASNTANVSWAAAAITVVDGSVTVTDALFATTTNLTGQLGVVWYTDPSPTSFSYTLSFAGVAGTCTDYNNTATFKTNTTATTGSSSQKVTVCVGKDLTVSKTVTPTFTQTYKWGIVKSVVGDALKNISGGTATFGYKVDVTHDAGTDSAWALSGKITVENPNDWKDVVLTDVTDVAGATNCNITKPAVLTVPKRVGATNGKLVLDYSCTMPNGTGGDNVATATWNSATYFTPTGSATGKATFAFATPTTIIDGSVTVTDTQLVTASNLTGYLGTVLYSELSPKSLTYSKTFQGVANSCQTFDNTATFTTNDTITNVTSNKVTVKVCASVLNVKKLTQGVVDATKTWQFNLFAGPHANDAFSSFGAVLASDSSLGKADGVLNFGNYNIDPAKTYTFCELNAPAGWASLWTFGGLPVTPYNPDRFPTTGFPNGQDLGRRCFDFGAGTAYAIPTGGTITFQVDNRFPGGEPRTIGFWKNWSSCTGGNQMDTATKNAGYSGPWSDAAASTARIAKGYLTLNDVLNPPGIVVGTFQIPAWNVSYTFPTTSYTKTGCEIAVALLGKQDGATGKNMANDAAYTLVAQLIAAKANTTAGAKSCPALTSAVTAADALLVNINFVGTGSYLDSKVKGSLLTLRNQAISLADTLDKYNNGLLCP